MRSKFVIKALPVAMALAMASAVQAESLGERAVYTMKVLHKDDLAAVGQCSAFTFGDIGDPLSNGCKGGFEDNALSCTVPFLIRNPGDCGFFPSTAPYLVGGDGVASDGLAGSMTIETAVADGSGNNTFSITSFQMDPYLGTAGGNFKTSMNPANTGAAMTGVGTVDSLGNMTLAPTGRVGVAQFFEDPVASLGIQPWNIDDATTVEAPDPTTGTYQGFTTGTSTNYLPGGGGANLVLTGRAIGDAAPTAGPDGILDAILVSAGNVGTPWGFFDGTPYSEAFNVQFVLVSAKPVANDDTLVGTPTNPLVIDIATDLLANDVHADVTETISLVSVTQPTGTNSSIVWDGSSATMTFNPPDIGVATDTFTYTITDVGNNTHTATVTVNLATGNPPTAIDDPLTADEDVATPIDPTLNDEDQNPNDVLTVVDFDVVSTNLGTITAGTGNELIYQSAANYFGPDSFDYTITDGNGNIASATVLVTVDPVNDPLVCTDVEFFTDIDVPVDIIIATELLSTCEDVVNENDVATFVVAQTPSDQDGNISNDGAGNLVYTPPLGFAGKDTFTYTATDGEDNDVRTIKVNVGTNFGNFTMLNAAGNRFGGTNDVNFDYDGDQTLNTDEADYTNNRNFNLRISSDGPEKFNGFVWIAHTTRAFGPGTYSFDTGCRIDEIETTGCPAGSADNSGPTLTMTVDVGQIGVHILFDWSTSSNIDVVNVYNLNAPWDDLGAEAPKNALWLGAAGLAPDPTTDWEWVSTDDDEDGEVGVKMVDGPFIDYSANFNKGPGASSNVPTSTFTGSAADTKLGNGSLGLAVLLSNILLLIGVRSFTRKRNNIKVTS